MRRIRFVLNIAAFIVLGLCIVAAFFCGTFTPGGDKMYYAFGWYFLAKGLFCSLSLYVSGVALEKLAELANRQ